MHSTNTNNNKDRKLCTMSDAMSAKYGSDFVEKEDCRTRPKEAWNCTAKIQKQNVKARSCQMGKASEGGDA